MGVLVHAEIYEVKIYISFEQQLSVGSYCRMYGVVHTEMLTRLEFPQNYGALL